jgi:hypothetical protein
MLVRTELTVHSFRLAEVHKASMIHSVFLFLVAAVTSFVTSGGCPKPLDVQNPTLAASFDLNKFIGVNNEPYYELALHDNTQPKECSCMRSVKALSPDPAAPYLMDNFTMACPFDETNEKEGKIYISPLSFNFTDAPGVLMGHWEVTGDKNIPDTIVSVGEPDEGGSVYRWALEFQCIENERTGKISFVGINFYARARVGEEAERSYSEMLLAAQVAGIDTYYANTKQGLRMVDHTYCYYY